MVQVRVAHQGREYDMDMTIKGQPSAQEVKAAVAKQLNLTPDVFTLKHEGSDLSDEFAKQLSSDPTAEFELVCDQRDVGLREILNADELSRTIIVEHLSMADMRQAENMLLHHFGRFGRVSRLFLQLDGTWQQSWALVVYSQDTDMQKIPTSGSLAFSENSTTKLLTSLEVAQAGTAHLFAFLSDHFRHGKVEGQLGAAIMRNAEPTAGSNSERCIVRVIEENSPVQALRAWVVNKDDDPFDAFLEAEERSSLPRVEQSLSGSRSRSSSLHSDTSPPQTQGRRPSHPAFVHTRAMAGRILHTAAQEADALRSVPARDRPGHTPGCVCNSCKCGTNCSCSACENVSTTSQQGSETTPREEQEEESKADAGTSTMTLTHNSGCTCKNCQCGHECVCDNCAHWSR